MKQEYKITDTMRKWKENKDEALAIIKCDLFLQKYNRPPTAVEFLVLEDEIIEVADMIYKHLYFKKKGRRSA